MCKKPCSETAYVTTVAVHNSILQILDKWQRKEFLSLAPVKDEVWK